MLIRTSLLLSLLMTICVCRYDENVERQTIYYDDDQEINVAPGDVDVTVDIDAAEPLSHVEEYFVSVTIISGDINKIVEKMNFRLLYVLAFSGVLHDDQRLFLEINVRTHFH